MKAYINEIKKKIAPYVHRAFLDREYINEADLPAVRTLLRPFPNVKVRIEKTRQNDGHLDCVISVDAILGGGTLRSWAAERSGMRSAITGGERNIMIRSHGSMR